MVTVIAGNPRRMREKGLLLLQPSTSRNDGCCCDRDPVAALLPAGAVTTKPAAGVVEAPPGRWERDDGVALAGPKSRRQASTPHVRDLCRLRILGNNDCSCSLPAGTKLPCSSSTGLVRCLVYSTTTCVSKFLACVSLDQHHPQQWLAPSSYLPRKSSLFV